MKHAELPAASAALLGALVQHDCAQVRADFARWQSAVVIEQLPADHFALLPAVVDRLQHCAVTPDARLLGIVRRARLRRLQALTEAEQAVQILQRAGIRTLPFGRLALIKQLPAAFAVDTLERLDLAVDVQQLAAATAALQAAGWQVRGGADDVGAERWGWTRLFRHADRPLPLYLSWRLVADGPLLPLQATAEREGFSSAELLIMSVGVARRGGMNGLRALADSAILAEAATAEIQQQIAAVSAAHETAADLLQADALLHAVGAVLLPAASAAGLRQQAAQQPTPAAWTTTLQESFLVRPARHLAQWRRLCRHGRIAATPLSFVAYLRSLRRVRSTAR